MCWIKLTVCLSVFECEFMIVLLLYCTVLRRLPSPFITTCPESWYSFYYPHRGQKAELSLLAGLDDLPAPPQTVAHPVTKHACQLNALPLRHASNCACESVSGNVVYGWSLSLQSTQPSIMPVVSLFLLSQVLLLHRLEYCNNDR